MSKSLAKRLLENINSIENAQITSKGRKTLNSSIYIVNDERIGGTCYFDDEDTFNSWFTTTWPDEEIPEDLEAWDAQLYRKENGSAIYVVERPHNTGYGRYETTREFYRVWPTGEAEFIEKPENSIDK